MDNTPSQIVETEIDILEYAERGEAVPHARAYHVLIDGERFKIETHSPTVEALLGKVHKCPCAYDLIAEFKGHENYELKPDETVDLCRPGLKGFITAHKEIVTIFFTEEKTPFEISRGEHSVEDIMALPKTGETPAGFDLYLEEPGKPPAPLPANQPVKIHRVRAIPRTAKDGRSVVELMEYTTDQTDALKPYCSKLSLLDEGGVPYFQLEGLRLPKGCTPEVCDALLCPATGQTNYPSRLFLAQQVTCPYARNWNGNVRVGEKNWVAFSWTVQAGLSLVEMLNAHLSGFTRE